jgi:predicted transcriptional regulator
MSTFTSSLPDDLLEKLTKAALALSVPKNKIIERALRLYLDQLNRAEYAQSYKQMAQDADLMKVAEEGMADYMQQLDDAAR